MENFQDTFNDDSSTEEVEELLTDSDNKPPSSHLLLLVQHECLGVVKCKYRRTVRTPEQEINTIVLAYGNSTWIFFELVESSLSSISLNNSQPSL